MMPSSSDSSLPFGHTFKSWLCGSLLILSQWSAMSNAYSFAAGGPAGMTSPQIITPEAIHEALAKADLFSFSLSSPKLQESLNAERLKERQENQVSHTRQHIDAHVQARTKKMDPVLLAKLAATASSAASLNETRSSMDHLDDWSAEMRETEKESEKEKKFLEIHPQEWLSKISLPPHSPLASPSVSRANSDERETQRETESLSESEILSLSERQSNSVSVSSSYLPSFTCASFPSVYTPYMFCSGVVDYPYYLMDGLTAEDLDLQARTLGSYFTSYLNTQCLTDVKRYLCASIYLPCVSGGESLSRFLFCFQIDDSLFLFSHSLSFFLSFSFFLFLSLFLSPIQLSQVTIPPMNQYLVWVFPSLTNALASKSLSLSLSPSPVC
jgi:hypothetical protein